MPADDVNNFVTQFNRFASNKQAVEDAIHEVRTGMNHTGPKATVTNMSGSVIVE